MSEIYRFGWDEVAFDWYDDVDSALPRNMEKEKPDFYLKSGTFGRGMVFIEVMGTNLEKLHRFKEFFSKKLDKLEISDVRKSWSSCMDKLMDKFEEKEEIPKGKLRINPDLGAECWDGQNWNVVYPMDDQWVVKGGIVSSKK